MESIPNEILVNITTHLNPEERLQCAMVCKNWYFGLVHSNLYEAITFPSTEKCKSAINYFSKQEPSIQKKVIMLKLFCNYEATKLPFAFPNIEKLVWTDENFSGKDLIQPTIDGDFDNHIHNWKHIQEITEANWHYPITRALLKSSYTALNLTYIDLSFHSRRYSNSDLSHYCSSYHRVRELVPHLKNAENLKFLRLNKIYLTLQDMEQIHEGTRSLKIIELRGVKIRLKNSDQQTDIQNRYWKGTKVHLKQLCCHISHLDIELAHEIGDFEGEHRDLTMWFRYIGVKYTNLTHFSINMDHIADNHAMELYYQRPLLKSKTFSKWKNLSVLDMGVIPLTRVLMKAIDSSRIQLKRLTIHFSEMSSHTQLEAIVKSKQKLSIKVLDVKTKQSILKSSHEGLHLIKLIHSLSSLKELVLSSLYFDSQNGLYEDILLLEILKHTSDSLLSLTCFGTFIEGETIDNFFWHHHYKLSDTEFPTPKVPFRSSLEELNILQCRILSNQENSKFNDTLTSLLAGCPSVVRLQLTTARTEFTMTSFNNPLAVRISSIELNLLNQLLLEQMKIDISGESIYEVLDQDGQQKWILQHKYGESFVEIPMPLSHKRKYPSLVLPHPIILNGAILSH